jgi:hypothetical protein
MQAQAPNMNATTQIIMSAAIGGTAEALGGGKFANGVIRIKSLNLPVILN